MDARAYILPFKRDGEEPDREEDARRIPPEQERTIYFFEWMLILSRWDKDVWRKLPERPKYFTDFGDLVISLAVARWPEYGPP